MRPISRAPATDDLVTLPAWGGYLGLFGVIFVAEAGVPLLVPTELVLIAAGVAAADGSVSLAGVVAVAAAADVLGTVVLFAAVRRGHGLLGGGRAASILTQAGARAATLVGAGLLRITLARCIPFVRLPAGATAALAGIALRRYVAAAVIGAGVWVWAFVGGAYLFAP